MKTKSKKRKLTDEEIDEIVIAQADDDSAVGFKRDLAAKAAR
ncbi:MAG TPA: hypothetical protein VE715_00955 [Blastocatellia bacterium]|nr:hypothetical protein [Blastocatellia bacterium]